MFGLDTNVLVRYITQDDPKQAKLATSLIETKLSEQVPGYITLISLVEVFWVLKRAYGAGKAELLEVITTVLTTKKFVVENHREACKALRLYQEGNGDFSDALIAVLSLNEGCAKVYTFDKKACSVGMSRLD
ncbi:type II toxin-antitoxin system VapC family toxin [Endozoicomonas sp. SM1973]|uniref:Type II toxin-antitoxin system VapC family toxin n=1 Tax=Spartinivicinus marinus TaxID=2994442 RepID=A0A853I6F4_9GAMM|nr:type II toxin-antitoxin system VapC family toxin [Spartinivicinus marinus]MCX4024722.1 type II toxin-antitoxin system VapC family toxin [Spartinivicinus marinus]NYZ66248.1 type II toxin-antitoxin system VapC family toxin [Spartinivicinus marinus]